MHVLIGFGIMVVIISMLTSTSEGRAAARVKMKRWDWLLWIPTVLLIIGLLIPAS